LRVVNAKTTQKGQPISVTSMGAEIAGPYSTRNANGCASHWQSTGFSLANSPTNVRSKKRETN
jgi:hypothetical protein